MLSMLLILIHTQYPNRLLQVADGIYQNYATLLNGEMKLELSDVPVASKLRTYVNQYD